MKFWVLQLGYEEVFGEKAEWPGVERRLQRYSLRAVLDVVGKISAYLDGVEGSAADVAAQKLISDGLFGPASGQRVWEKVAAYARKHPEVRSIALFGELQLINVVKVALLMMPTEDRESDEDLGGLGEAMLMIGELMHGELEPVVPLDRSAPMPPEWKLLIVANALFHAGGAWRNDLGRSHELYLKDRPHLHAHPAYVDLPGRVKARTGLDPVNLWSVLFALQAHWAAFDATSLHQLSGGVDADTYFTAHYRFSPEEVKQFFGLCAASAADIQVRVRAEYSRGHLDPLDVLPFAQTPLMQLGQMVYAPSRKLVAEKLGKGLYHLLLGSAGPTADSKRVLDYMGAVFEDYVDELLRRVYPATSGRYVDARTLGSLLPGKSCDAVLIFPDALVLLECKAKLFPLDVRRARRVDQLEAALKATYLTAAPQLSATVDAAQRGLLRPVGIDPARIRSYMPVLLSQDDVAMVRPLHADVVAAVKAQGLLQQEGVKRLQGIAIGELEALEEDLDRTSLYGVLEAKESSPEWWDESLRNYCFAERKGLMENRNRYLLGVLESLFAATIALFRARNVSDETIGDAPTGPLLPTRDNDGGPATME
jgi:hypothetical protein